MDKGRGLPPVPPLASGVVAMNRLASLGPLALVLAGPARAAAAPPPGPPDLRIAFWFRRNDPLNTFQFQAYDIRKGEYNPAVVEAWLTRIRRDFPAYKAYVKDVRLAPGEEARRKVAATIIDEHIATGGPYTGLGLHGIQDRIFGGAIGSLYHPQGLGLTSEAPRLSGGPGSARPLRSPPEVGGGGSGAFSPPSYPSPVPYPYPRPHP